jgi:hypothetical protein
MASVFDLKPELLSYVVTVIGLPLAIGVFLYEQHRSATTRRRKSITCCPRLRGFPETGDRQSDLKLRSRGPSRR